jgi:hypothetical protein
MANVSNAGYTAVVKRIVFEDAVSTSNPFEWMEIGSGSAAGAQASISLSSAMTDTGLTKATMTAGAATTADGRYFASTDLTGDTAWFRNTWTCGVSSIASGVKECGVFNSTGANTGDMLCYGTFPTAIPMGTGDTLQVTWSVQVKAGA